MGTIDITKPLLLTAVSSNAVDKRRQQQQFFIWKIRECQESKQFQSILKFNIFQNSQQNEIL